MHRYTTVRRPKCELAARSVRKRTKGRSLLPVIAFAAALAAPAIARAEAGKSDDRIGRVCDLIEAEAEVNGLPRDFLARLIWKESRFDSNAVSPAGAQGIAQFMPATARRRGLKDSFDIDQAIAASASYLADLKDRFGNLGLAAAAYNAGEDRVSSWLASGGFLPIETEEYVRSILGEPVDHFAKRDHKATVMPLRPGLGFHEACRALPVTQSATVAMSTVVVKPWGVQVAGNFSRAAAVRQWQRIRKSLPDSLARLEPVVSHVRSPMGRRGIYAVRIGAGDRKEADAICDRLHKAGGACVVMRNK